MVTFWVETPELAEIDTVCGVMLLAAVAVNVAESLPALTMTLDGTLSAVLVDWSATVIAVAAGVVNVTIQVALCAAPNISGVHASDVNWPEGISVTVESTDDSLVEAVTVTV